MAEDGLGNYKGVMLCNRPGVAEATAPPKPFLSRVAIQSQLGIPPPKQDEETPISEIISNLEKDPSQDPILLKKLEQLREQQEGSGNKGVVILQGCLIGNAATGEDTSGCKIDVGFNCGGGGAPKIGSIHDTIVVVPKFKQINTKDEGNSKKRLNWEIQKRNSEWLKQLVEKSKVSFVEKEKAEERVAEKEKRLRALADRYRGDVQKMKSEEKDGYLKEIKNRKRRIPRWVKERWDDRLFEAACQIRREEKSSPSTKKVAINSRADVLNPQQLSSVDHQGDETAAGEYREIIADNDSSTQASRVSSAANGLSANLENTDLELDISSDKDLLDFAKNLNYDEFVEDLEFREALAILKDRTKKIEREERLFKMNVAALVDENGNAIEVEQPTKKDDHNHSGTTINNKNSDNDAGSKGGGDDHGSEVGSDLSHLINRVQDELRMIHSKQSAARVVEKVAVS